MGQRRVHGGRRQGNLLEEHQDMICKIILLGLAGLTLAGEPDVFQNYFDDTIKEVDIPLDAAIKACLQNGNTFADKVKRPMQIVLAVQIMILETSLQRRALKTLTMMACQIVLKIMNNVSTRRWAG